MKLAEKADLSVGYICDLESGRRWGTPETFSKLAQALAINPYELLLPVSSELSEADSVATIALREYLTEMGNTLCANIRTAVNQAISETLQQELSL